MAKFMMLGRSKFFNFYKVGIKNKFREKIHNFIGDKTYFKEEKNDYSFSN
jgi:hypothetical protein